MVILIAGVRSKRSFHRLSRNWKTFPFSGTLILLDLRCTCQLMKYVRNNYVASQRDIPCKSIKPKMSAKNLNGIAKESEHSFTLKIRKRKLIFAIVFSHHSLLKFVPPKFRHLWSQICVEEHMVLRKPLLIRTSAASFT